MHLKLLLAKKQRACSHIFWIAELAACSCWRQLLPAAPRRSPSFECFAQLPGSINPTQRESEKLKLDDYTGYRYELLKSSTSRTSRCACKLYYSSTVQLYSCNHSTPALAAACLPSCVYRRVMYHVEKFTAGWRNLVLFYLAM
jgi:hypothetical protein